MLPMMRGLRRVLAGFRPGPGAAGQAREELFETALSPPPSTGDLTGRFVAALGAEGARAFAVTDFAVSGLDDRAGRRIRTTVLLGAENRILVETRAEGLVEQGTAQAIATRVADRLRDLLAITEQAGA